MNRREFLTKAGVFAGATSLRPLFGQTLSSSTTPAPTHSHAQAAISFETTDHHYQATYHHALKVLAANVVTLPSYPHPVLIEGSAYQGIWLECAPQEGLVYSQIRPDVARNNHFSFFARQREDGQIPCWIRAKATGLSQIQMVVPIAATAWELSQQTGDSELLEKAYPACARWDAWLRRYRDTRHTGLCEGFCTWDTGHDNSPRWSGMPNSCPDHDARKCPTLPSLPRLSPDLSATVYGGRIALAAMARALGKNSEADHWLADAETIRTAILDKLYSPDDAAFYDLDAQNKFVHVRGDVISRVLGEHVVDQKLFDTIYKKQIHNPAAFWASYPLPSVAMDDPAFVRPIPRNSWGGASQALTALRAPRWMEHYGKPADLAHLMQQWVHAISRAGKFLQQMDPLNGKFTPDKGDYSPAALVFLDFTWRLAGARRDENGLEWNLRPNADGTSSSYRLRLPGGQSAELKYSGKPGVAECLLNGKFLFRSNNVVRLTTDRNGQLRGATGIAPEKTHVTLHTLNGKRKFSIEPNSGMEFLPKHKI
ncbi:MAG TPA: alpha-L-rhamnosidase [Terriglobales bacterium]|jgi:hypothetical protein